MRRAVLGLALTVPMLAGPMLAGPMLAGPMLAGPMLAGPMPAGPALAGAAVGAPAVVAAGTVAAAALASPVPAAGNTAAAPGFPLPPPVDPRRLPPDSRPSALAGARQAVQCVRDQPAPNPDALSTLLWGRRSLRLPELWSSGQGERVRVAVIDTGVARHPLLAERLVAGGDFVAGGNGLSDCDGHGTAVAGIAAAAADAGTDFAGVAPRAEVLSIRQSSPSFQVTSTDGTTRPAGDVGTLAKAVLHAVELGADVVNISEVGCTTPDRIGAAGPALQAAIRSAVQRNVVVVAAAGNAGSGGCPAQPDAGDVVLPAWYDEDVLTVASIGPDGVVSPFSIRGPWVDVAAPGEQLVSLSPTGSGLTDRYSSPKAPVGPIQGTSFAAPAVAGLAALVRARYPRLTARQVMDRITATATQRSARRDLSIGFGVIDPVRALSQAPAVLTPPRRDEALAAGTGTLPLAAVAHEQPAGPAALWGGALALLAAVSAGALAVARFRIQPRR